ncbi:RHS repeat-associated core domain-containing protein, partial [uncultured Alistipes sp.]|uniref:RHS repeat domain-containing protein n=1 Tax=uncultured Alistipes sp. TaxID=538949 RepID=UPI00322070A7
MERLFGVDTRASEQITYDALGRIKTHTGTSSIPEYAFTRSYAYDAIGRLASYSDGENTEDYLYDALGNRTEKQTDGKTAAAYQYNAMNQLTAMTQGEETYSYLYDQRGNLTEERHGEQVLRNYAYDAANRMVSGKNLVSGTKSEYTYNGLLARVKKTSGAQASSYMPDYAGGIHNDLMTQIAGAGTVNAVYGQGYGRASQRFMPEAATGAADTYFQHDLYGSTLFAADAQGAIRHHAVHDIWGMPETACGDSSVASGLRFTTYDYDAVLGKHFAHARMYDPSQGRMLGADPVKRGLNGYAYCDNDPVNQTDPTGEVASILIGGIVGGVIGGAFGFAGSALSQIAGGKGFNARKAWGAAANGAIVGAARGALVGSGAGIPLAFGVNFAAGMAGSLAEQKIAGEQTAPVRAAVDGAFNAAGGRLYGTSPLRNAKDAFMRGALEGALKGGAYNIADVLDNKLRNAYGSGGRRNPGTRNSWNKDNRNPWNSRNPRPTGSRCP